MRIGFFSPLPPARTGVADYSAALIGAMRESGTVEVNRPGDINLYHLGNNALHRGIYRRAIEEPGIVVLHDAVLDHFFLGQLDKEAYVAEFVYNYGPWTEELAVRLWDGRARSAADPLYFRYPMLRRVVERSRAVMVHNPAAERIARAHGAVGVHRIPHLFEASAPVPEYEVMRMREKLGLLTSDLLLAVFGHLRETKRIPTILRAFHRVRRERDNVKLLVAGDFASRDLALALAGELNAPGVIRTGYLSAGEFWQYAAATDVCINLRWPSAGNVGHSGTVHGDWQVRHCDRGRRDKRVSRRIVDSGGEWSGRGRNADCVSAVACGQPRTGAGNRRSRRRAYRRIPRPHACRRRILARACRLL